MANKVIKIGFDTQTMDNAIKDLKAYQDWFEQGLDTFVDRMAQEGLKVAQVKFNNSLVSGVNDVQVSVTNKGRTVRTILALGTATWFIEFGTGVTNPDIHPEKPSGVSERGTYGKGRGKNPKGWIYAGVPGTNGSPSSTKPGYMHTYGDPANMPMYNTKKELEQRVWKIARECFK